MKNNKLLAFIACILIALPIEAQISGTGGRRQSVALKYGADQIGNRTDLSMQEWRESGVGQFIHWGVYSIPGGHWDGRFIGNASEWIRRSLKPEERLDYDKLYKEFNPKNFNAKAWAKQAKHMGAKYVIFTTKHHDGFCMWPSKYTDYTIANSPYKKDIVKEIVDAYTAEGIKVHLYFSIIDWNHKGYSGAVPKTEEEKTGYEEFKAFTRNQLLELMDNYPSLSGIWFDGSWDAAWIKEAVWVGELNKELRAKKSGIIIGSRFRSDEFGNRGYDANGDLIGDYDQSWERDLPESHEYLKGVDWDCIMTVPENGWGYHSAPKGYVKTSYNFIDLLANCVSLGGNFVLNFGPDRDGNIIPRDAKFAQDIGDWMKVNGEAIHAAKHIGLIKQGWGYYTHKSNKLFMNVFNIPINNQLLVRIPKGTIKPIKAYFLQNGKAVEIIDGGRNKKEDNLFYIALPEGFKSAEPFVIVIDIEGNIGDTNKYEQSHT